RNAPLSPLTPENELFLLEFLRKPENWPLWDTYQLEGRYSYLKNGSCSLGKRRIYPIEAPDATAEVTIAHLRYALHPGNMSPGFPTVSDGQLIRRNFFAYYRIACSGSKEEREKLRRFL